jgi:iron complex outermembrane receptor protein
MRTLLLSTALVSAAAVMTARPAEAADAPVATAAAAPSSTLAEVVVTARKREENLQTVPVSASVMSATVIQQTNIINFQDLRGAVPDLQVTPIAGGVGTNLTIRGVGQGSFQANADPKSGLYVDEGYVARPEGNSLSFYDLSNLQVLYGPQGTLFGRNTTGGAVLVTTQRPSSSGSSYLQMRYGNFNRLDTEGGINVPILDNLFARFSFRTENRDGYITHLLDDHKDDNVNDKSFRGQLRWDPVEKASVDLMYEHDQSNTTGIVSVLTGCASTGGYQPNYNNTHPVTYCNQYPALGKKYEVYGGAVFTGPTSAVQTPLATGGDYSPGGLTPFGHPTPFNDVNVDTVNARLIYDLTPDLTVKSVTTNRMSKATKYTPTVDAPNDIYQEYDNAPSTETTEEINLTGKYFDNRLNFVVGGYFFDLHTSFLQFDGTDWTDPTGYNDFETNYERSYAGYFQASFDVTPQLELTAGGRYTSDYKRATADITYANYLGTAPAACTVSSYIKPAAAGGTKTVFNTQFQLGAMCNQTLMAANSASWSNFDPMGSIRYKITNNASAYVTVRSAYNEGGFNSHAPPTNIALRGTILSYDPEHFTDFEGGFKTEWLDHTLRVNVDAYYQKFSDIQGGSLVTINGIATRTTTNVGTAHYDGFEGELTWAPIADFNMTVNGSFFDAKYDSILPAAQSSTFTLSTPIVGVAAPAYTYSVSGNYTVHPYKESLLTLSLNYKATAPLKSCQVGANYTCEIPAYGLLGGQLKFQISPDNPWTVSMWGTNLTNAYWLLGKAVINPISVNMGISSDTPGTPREFGISIKRTF